MFHALDICILLHVMLRDTDILLGFTIKHFSCAFFLLLFVLSCIVLTCINCIFCTCKSCIHFNIKPSFYVIKCMLYILYCHVLCLQHTGFKTHIDEEFNGPQFDSNRRPLLYVILLFTSPHFLSVSLNIK